MMKGCLSMKQLLILLTIIATLSLCSCGGTSQYDKDLNSGIQKMKSGEKMTEGEKNATNDFLDYQKSH